ncbi:hypothetical protein DFJ77DRAFT_455889 [Powellomyces hirtus]|nr:hypothetical protein DFJ77DRAFT_455889 [Powellomyces hirtus]
MKVWESRQLCALAVLVLGALIAPLSLAAPLNATAVSNVAAAEPYAAFLYVYFEGEEDVDGEQIYFAISEWADPLHWRVLNRGKPILVSNVGNKGIRDPTIVRTATGFHILATDLRIQGTQPNWDALQRRQSRNLVMWDASDIITWSQARLVPVSPATAGNTWAPDAIWDPAVNKWMMYWSSTIYPENDPQHTSGRDKVWNQLLASHTSDFQTFSPAKVYENTGQDLFDTTIVRADDGTFHKFGHDTRFGRFINHQSGPSLNGPWKLLAQEIGKNDAAYTEGPFVFRAIDGKKWYLWGDSTGTRGYLPHETDDINSGVWTLCKNYSLPAIPRHGSVIPITYHERNQLAAKWLRPYRP